MQFIFLSNCNIKSDLYNHNSEFYQNTIKINSVEVYGINRILYLKQE